MTPPLKPHLGRSDLRGASALLRDWLGLATIVWAAETLAPAWLYPVWFVLIANLQFALGESLTHEASHGQLFATKRLNTLVAPLVSWPFLFTLGDYRTEHLHHHRRLGHPDDHLPHAYARYGLRPLDARPPDGPLSPSRALWIWAGRPLVGLPAWYYLTDVAQMLRAPDREARWMLATWAAVLATCAWLGWLPLLAWYWLLPMLLGFTTLYYWSEVGDHFVVPTGDTRTRLNPISNWLHHHNGYHALHHRYPTIPFFRLPAAYQALKGTFPETVSTGWLDTLRQLSALAGEDEAVSAAK